MKTSVTIICLFGLLFFTACSKDDDNPNSIPVDEEEILKSSEKEITSFVFETGNNTVLTEDLTATITESNKTISTTVAYGMDISALSPTIQISDKASINPSGAQDFSSPVTYTVTAEDGSQKIYSVTITISPNTESAIVSFEFLLSENPVDVNVIAEIDEENKLITFDIPDGADISALLPTIKISDDATISPEGLQNFEEPVTYTVTGQDGSTAEYEVNAVLSQKGVLLALYNANPGNTLGWDTESDNIGNWDGVETDGEGFIIELYLDKQNLSVLPPEIGKLAKLTYLTLHENQLIEIPKEIENLTNLGYLTLYENQLIKIPKEIGNLINLGLLNLNDNKLIAIPKEIGNLTNLTVLYSNNNQLTKIPVEIGNLTNLSVLFLDNNQLTEIPPEISKLTKLKDLILSHNHLVEIPEDIGKMNNLKGLSLSNNNLSELPAKIGNLVNLTSLGLSGNNLTQITEEVGNLVNLNALILSNNNLTQLSEKFGNLTNLSFLDLMENQLITIPQAVCDLETDHGTFIKKDAGVTCK